MLEIGRLVVGWIGVFGGLVRWCANESNDAAVMRQSTSLHSCKVMFSEFGARSWLMMFCNSYRIVQRYGLWVGTRNIINRTKLSLRFSKQITFISPSSLNMSSKKLARKSTANMERKSTTNMIRKSTATVPSKSRAKSSKSSKSVDSVSKTSKKSPIKKNVILQKNLNEIGKKNMDRMRQICDKLGIEKGVNIGVSLYGYPSHLAVYMSLLKMVKMTDDERNVVLEGLNSNAFRDIKSKIGSEGKTGRKNEMMEGIVKKLKEIAVNYQRWKATGNALESPRNISKEKLSPSNDRIHRKKQRKRELESPSKNIAQNKRRKLTKSNTDNPSDHYINFTGQREVISSKGTISITSRLLPER